MRYAAVVAFQLHGLIHGFVLVVYGLRFAVYYSLIFLLRFAALCFTLGLRGLVSNLHLASLHLVLHCSSSFFCRFTFVVGLFAAAWLVFTAFGCCSSFYVIWLCSLRCLAAYAYQGAFGSMVWCNSRFLFFGIVHVCLVAAATCLYCWLLAL